MMELFEKMKKKYASIIIFFVVILICLSACQKTDMSRSKLNLTVKEQEWTGDTQNQPEPTVNVYDDIENGMVIFDRNGIGKITVDSANDTQIQLRLDDSSFVEENDNGTIDLLCDPIKELIVKCGEEKVIVSQTMDWGVILSIRVDAAQ